MTKARTLADNFAADINAVTANAPLTGGGTSGTVTVGIQAGTTAQSGAVQLTDSTASTSTTTAATPNSVKSAYDLANTANTAASSAQTTANAAIAKSTIDAKGDLLVGTANDTVSRLAVASTAGYLLTVDSAEATGLKWAAPAGGGKVLQVVSATTNTFVSTNNAAWTDTTLSCSITPTLSTSKVLVLVTQTAYAGGANATGLGIGWRLRRGTTTVYMGANTYLNLYTGDTSAGTETREIGATLTMNYLDSPATTSSITYKTQIDSSGTARNGNINYETGSMILLEIGA